jgi:Arc/MetJ-type ribon-helix-helix transcriptional regulator
VATPEIALPDEFEEFAAPFVASGRYANSTEVLYAAMDALLRAEADELSYNEACIRSAEEGEASGLSPGDVLARLRSVHGFSDPNLL